MTIPQPPPDQDEPRDPEPDGPWGDPVHETPVEPPERGPGIEEPPMRMPGEDPDGELEPGA